MCENGDDLGVRAEAARVAQIVAAGEQAVVATAARLIEKKKPLKLVEDRVCKERKEKTWLTLMRERFARSGARGRRRRRVGLRW